MFLLADAMSGNCGLVATAVIASVSGDRYFSNDVNHSMPMGPALIGEEIDDSVDLTPGDMFHHIVIYWGRCLQLP